MTYAGISLTPPDIPVGTINLAGSYTVSLPYSAGGHSSISLPPFTPMAGEILVVKVMYRTGNIGTGVSDGVNTYTSQVNTQPHTLGVALFTAAAMSSAPVTVTCPLAGGSVGPLMLVAERWAGAKLAAFPVIVNDSAPTSGLAHDTITTAGTGSWVSWICTDDGVYGDGSTRVYDTSSAPVTEVYADYTGYAQNFCVAYCAAQPAAAAGVQNFGLTTPSTIDWVMCAIELQQA